MSKDLKIAAGFILVLAAYVWAVGLSAIGLLLLANYVGLV